MAPANFRSFESQSRLLAAVIASNPGLKLNFKEIADAYGSDTTPSGIDHRLRIVKYDARNVRATMDKGVDSKELKIGSGKSTDPKIGSADPDEIHKYFGSSTPSGLEFQFRSIRKEAKALTEAVERGDDPSTLKTGSVEYRHDKGASSGRGRGRPRGSGSGKGGKGRKAAAGASDDDEEMEDAETGDPDSSYNSTPTPASKRGGKSANNRVLGSNSRVSKSSPLKKGGSSFGTSSQEAIAVDSEDDDDDGDKGVKVQVKKEKVAVPAAAEEDDEDDDPNEFYGGERDDEDRSGYYNLPAGFTAASIQRSFKIEADEEFDDLV